VVPVKNAEGEGREGSEVSEMDTKGTRKLLSPPLHYSPASIPVGAGCGACTCKKSLTSEGVGTSRTSSVELAGKCNRLGRDA
jgi:hypothetical protein